MKNGKIIPLYSYLKPLYQYLGDTFCTNVKISWERLIIRRGNVIIPIEFNSEGEIYQGELWKDSGLIGFNTQSEKGRGYSTEVELSVLREYL